MQLKLDTSKTYAIALEGGGAKGAYEIGVWTALEEAGIKYNAVSGTSIGALNGAMMTERDLPLAVSAWKDIRLTDIINIPDEDEDEMLRFFGGELEPTDLREVVPQMLEIIKNRGLDIAPLRQWIRSIADTKRIKASDVEFFISTVSLSDKKALTVRINDLPEDEICDMLLASAYHPSFRLEKIRGKYYADGALADNLPISPLVEHGYKNIIAVCLPGHGVHKHFKLPPDVSITYIHPDSDLGGVLCFDAEQARRNMKLGYLDAKRVLCGLEGRSYYLERSLSEREALDILAEKLGSPENGLRYLLEWELPETARELELEDWDYYKLLISIAERSAAEKEIERMRIIPDTELVAAALAE